MKTLMRSCMYREDNSPISSLPELGHPSRKEPPLSPLLASVGFPVLQAQPANVSVILRVIGR